MAWEVVRVVDSENDRAVVQSYHRSSVKSAGGLSLMVVAAALYSPLALRTLGAHLVHRGSRMAFYFICCRVSRFLRYRKV